jgi:alkanesulfonate monooxygenase SsuD/methylene tetrahydromethanopterin reductase-like flavin-dependent oxidoreductase (luciferase family)
MKIASRLRRGLYLAPFELAVAAKEAGWDGVFLWDHILWRAPVRAVADPWVALSAIAAHTQRVRLGPLVTPLARRRVHKLARETATLAYAPPPQSCARTDGEPPASNPALIGTGTD